MVAIYNSQNPNTNIKYPNKPPTRKRELNSASGYHQITINRHEKYVLKSQAQGKSLFWLNSISSIDEALYARQFLYRTYGIGRDVEFSINVDDYQKHALGSALKKKYAEFDAEGRL